jgi:FKBP-type peptidyl-prolyl cis-trans isomerase
VVWGCGGESGDEPADITQLEFAQELGVDLGQMTRTPSGLYYQDLVLGEGEEAVVGASVSAHYTGWLHDGTKFDSSLDRGEPYSFPLGVGQVISGWDEGIQGMRVGGKRKLVIPAELAYGSAGRGTIPPDAPLVFDVELMEVSGS